MTYRNKWAESKAIRAASELRRCLRIKPGEEPRIGIILGTGWGDTLALENACAPYGLQSIPGFGAVMRDLQITGHRRYLRYGRLYGKPVIVLDGRLHLNEAWSAETINPLVRLQVEMLFHVGVRQLILTSAVGTLDVNELPVGGICVVRSFLTGYANATMPLLGGEFVDAEATLDRQLALLAQDRAERWGFPVISGRLAFVRGPGFESQTGDWPLFRKANAHVVGMSILPECYVAALYQENGIRTLALSYATNGPETNHSHEANLKQAGHAAAKLGGLLAVIVGALPNG